jgi:hypothetical protein
MAGMDEPYDCGKRGAGLARLPQPKTGKCHCPARVKAAARSHLCCQRSAGGTWISLVLPVPPVFWSQG